MKNLKKHFKMIITAVICFVMGVIPGKKNGKNEKKQILEFKCNGRGRESCVNGQALHKEHVGQASGNVNERIIYIQDWINNKNNRTGWTCSNGNVFKNKKVFFWMQGPGDRYGGFAEGTMGAGNEEKGELFVI